MGIKQNMKSEIVFQFPLEHCRNVTNSKEHFVDLISVCIYIYTYIYIYMLTHIYTQSHSHIYKCINAHTQKAKESIIAVPFPEQKDCFKKSRQFKKKQI